MTTWLTPGTQSAYNRVQARFVVIGLTAVVLVVRATVDARAADWQVWTEAED